MRLIGYVRVSKVGGREGESFISPDVQRDTIEHYAAARGHEVIRWVEDLDQPGTRWERPGLQGALDAVRSGEADGIAAARLDRLARSVTDGRRALRELTDAGGALVLVAEGLDTATPMGKAMFTILLAFAELEVDRIRENWKVAKDRAVERGVHATRAAPGYRRSAEGHLVPDPVEAPAVLEAFQMRARGRSLSAICAMLDERAPRADGAWPVTTVGQMFARRTYLGEGLGRNRHDAIVPRAVWEAAQVRAGTAPTRARAARLLTGLVFCGSCGRAMTGTTDGHGYQLYRCRGRKAEGVCDRRARVSVLRADAFVERAFLDWLGTKHVVVEERVADGGSEQDLAAALEIAEDELAAYRDESLVAVIGRESFAAGLTARQSAVDDARLALAQSARPPAVGLRLALQDEWPVFSVDERREILAAGVERVIVEPGRGDGRMRIVWRDDDPGPAAPPRSAPTTSLHGS